MEETLKAEPRRADGKGGARKVRAQGRVPAVVYGHGNDPMHFSVDSRELFHLLHTEAGANVLVNLQLDGDTVLAMPREVQRDHIRGRFIHVDFLRVARDEKLTVDVPVQLVGESRGVKEGGVIEHHLWTVQVECLPGDVPASIDADISDVGVGESLRVEELTAPTGVTILTPVEETIVSIISPAALRLAEEGVEEAAETAEAEAGGEGATGDEAAEHAGDDAGA